METRARDWLTLNTSASITHQISHNNLRELPACNDIRQVKFKVMEVFGEITSETPEVRTGQGIIKTIKKSDSVNIMRQSVIKMQFKCKYCLSANRFSGKIQLASFQNCFTSLWHWFNKVLETFLRDFGQYWHDTIMQICFLHIPYVNPPFLHISTVLYWIEISDQTHKLS